MARKKKITALEFAWITGLNPFMVNDILKKEIETLDGRDKKNYKEKDVEGIKFVYADIDDFEKISAKFFPKETTRIRALMNK